MRVPSRADATEGSREITAFLRAEVSERETDTEALPRGNYEGQIQKILQKRIRTTRFIMNRRSWRLIITYSYGSNVPWTSCSPSEPYHQG